MNGSPNLRVEPKKLSDATLVAPISGYIAKKSIETGDTGCRTGRYFKSSN